MNSPRAFQMTNEDRQMRLRFTACADISRILSAIACMILSLPVVCLADVPAASTEKLSVRLDTRGPYLILATDKASHAYADAIGKARALHPTAVHATFAADDVAAARKLLQDKHPRYVLLFILPD